MATGEGDAGGCGAATTKMEFSLLPIDNSRYLSCTCERFTAAGSGSVHIRSSLILQASFYKDIRILLHCTCSVQLGDVVGVVSEAWHTRLIRQRRTRPCRPRLCVSTPPSSRPSRRIAPVRQLVNHQGSCSVLLPPGRIGAHSPRQPWSGDPSPCAPRGPSRATSPGPRRAYGQLAARS